VEKSRVALRSVQERSVQDAVEELMEACRWEEIIAPGARVVIKPNLCMSVSHKVVGANTDMRLTESVIRVLQRRTTNIVVGESDHLRQKAQRGFEASGYLDMAQRLGVPLVNFTELPWRAVPCPPLDALELPEVLLDADVFITLPVLKTHALTYFTGALKNQWGCLPQYDRIVLHKHLDELLASLQGVLKPRLTLMDGIVGMEGRGPTNGKPRRLDVLLASRDAVALDVSAMRLVGLDPSRAKHLVLAAEQGLGRIAAEDIEEDGPWAAHRTQFEPAVLDGAVKAMNYMSRYRWFVRHFLERDTIFYPVRAVVQALRRVRLIAGG
jgi:uncharacterized protein (DUF362 family)